MKFKEEELTIYEVEVLHKNLLDEFDKGDIVLDVANVNKMDMSVIQLLISLQKSCHAHSKQFELKNVNETLLGILQNSACECLIGKSDD